MTPPILSILTPTILQRAESYAKLRKKLEGQIRDARLEDAVEILSLCDDGEVPTGTKRNQLMNMAAGTFVVSVDDDDDVHDRYVSRIVDLLRANPDVDCVGILGEVRYAGSAPRTFIYSNRYSEYASRNKVYYRPPHHLNPIRTEIARQYPFEDVWISEDSDWAMRVAKDCVLKSEVFLDDVSYYYNCRRHGWVQTAIDKTEWIRHPLGLQWSNRLRWKRWCAAWLSPKNNRLR